MKCQRCQVNPATVHVTEIVHPLPPDQEAQETGEPGAPADPAAAVPVPTTKGSSGAIQEQHLCESCAQAANLPHMPAMKKSVAEIWKLLQASAQRGRREGGVSCPECGMTLMEFRQKGRFGCPRDYEVFKPHLRDLFERIHGATRHIGRVPGLDERARERLERMNDLQRKLEDAIREEAYEDAAQLRDQIKLLQES